MPVAFFKGEYLMTNLENFYNTWREASFQAVINGDVDRQVSLWAEGCTRKAIDAFGDHHVIQGKEGIRELYNNWKSVKDWHLLYNELLSASKERGIGNAEVRWKNKDGEEYACNFIYMISLDEDGRCVSYTEWNVVRSRKSAVYY